jgi:hypothetical protein
MDMGGSYVLKGEVIKVKYLACGSRPDILV